MASKWSWPVVMGALVASVAFGCGSDGAGAKTSSEPINCQKYANTLSDISAATGKGETRPGERMKDINHCKAGVEKAPDEMRACYECVLAASGQTIAACQAADGACGKLEAKVGK